MKIPKVSQIQFKRPDLTPERKRYIGMAIPIVLVALIGLMSVSDAVHGWFDWVPVSHDNIVVDSVLKLVFGVLLTAVAVCVTLPVAMGFHVLGHAVAGHFFGMRVLAVRVGPILVTPWSIGDRYEILAVHGWQDIITGWVQFDDSPLPTWKRIRGWQVVMGGGSALNLGISFLAAMFSIFASGFLYVLLRQAVWLNLGVAVVNIIPFVWQRFEFESDGKRLMTLLFEEGDGSDALMERLRNEVVVGPIRPASWPRERENAWETSLRSAPATADGKSSQLETMVYLFLHAVDRGDSETAWRWVQAMHHTLSTDPENHDIEWETARVMCSVYSARWEKNADAARASLEQISPTSGMTMSPWYTVAKAATLYAEAEVATEDQRAGLENAMRIADIARDQLKEPARLHGVDQLMQGVAQSIRGDADVELQKQAYFEPAQTKPVIAPDPVAA